MSHIAVLPTPGMGHLIPLAEFSKKLHHRHRTTTTFIIPNDGGVSKAQSAFLDALPPYIRYVLLPPVDFSDLSPEMKIETRVALTVTRSLHSIRKAVDDLVHEVKTVDAFIFDLFATDGFDAAFEHEIPAYVFFPASGFALSLFFYLPTLDGAVSGEYGDVPAKIKIPGAVPIDGKDLLDPIQDRKNEAYKWVLHHAKRYGLAQGVILNSFKEFENGVVQSFHDRHSKGLSPRVFPVGPLVRTGGGDGNDGYDNVERCLKWLDEQPISSVLYVSFGSGGTLSHRQIKELAGGLEMSEQRFLWVLRCPNDKSSAATYFNIQNSDDPLSYLPAGFSERTKNRGLVVPFWAPQDKVLGHVSTGAFLTHCGFNSCLESVVSGVPMIAWPLYAEQRMNAVMLEEDVKVALRVKPGGEDGLVGGDEVAAVVKRLMEGEEGKGIRSKVRELREAASKVLGDGGESTKMMDELVGEWKKKKTMNKEK